MKKLKWKKTLVDTVTPSRSSRSSLSENNDSEKKPASTVVIQVTTAEDNIIKEVENKDFVTPIRVSKDNLYVEETPKEEFSSESRRTTYSGDRMSLVKDLGK